jgi:hypothetical protein
MHTIQQLLAIKDTVYGLLEWAEGVSDDEFARCCSLEHGLPEEVLLRMEAFCALSRGLGEECAGIVEGLDALCRGMEAECTQGEGA